MGEKDPARQEADSTMARAELTSCENKVAFSERSISARSKQSGSIGLVASGKSESLRDNGRGRVQVRNL